ncbi:MAG: hypothetical protein WC525_09975 [Candidatus Thermoplasmatota archaeon]
MGQNTGIKVSDEVEQRILELHELGYGFREIAHDVGLNFGSIGRILRRCGKSPRTPSLSHRKYNIDETFFDVIDREDKAYVLGILYADGCNVRWNNSKQVFANEVKLELNYRDKDVMDKILSCMKNVKPLTLKKAPRGWNKEPTYLMDICSKHISERLEELGCVQRKTKVLNYPEFLGDGLHNHFVRGYFDGDGSLALNHYPRSSPEWTILSTYDFSIHVKDILFKELGVRSGITYHSNRDNGQCYVRVPGANQVVTVCDWLYNGATIYLNRKYETYRILKSLHLHK